MNECMGTTSLAYHNECKERIEKKNAPKEDEILILLMEEEDGIEAV